MNLPAIRTLPFAAGLFLTLRGAALAQSDTAKPPVHKPDQSALNRVKQDDRSKKQLDEAIEKLREAAKRNETADKELKRVNEQDLKDNPAKAIGAIKDQLSTEDTAQLKKTLEKAVNSEEARKLADELKKKAVSSIKPKSGATTTPPEKFGPSTFDKVPGPVPVAPEVTAKPKTPDFSVDGDSIIFPPARDPANPQRALLPSDPRSRTYVVIGHAQVKTPSMVLDGDRIEMIASVEGGGLQAPQPRPKPAKPKAGDPVRPVSAAAEEKKPAPFDRVIATGRVRIVRIIDGKTETGKGGSMIYDKKSGTMILTDWPQAQVEGKVITGKSKDAKIILVPDGEPRVENCRIEGYETPDTAPAAASTGPPAAAPVPRATPVR